MYQLNSRSGLKAALLLGAAGAAIAAYSTPAQAIETVVVTGSRIPQTGLYSASPVTTVSTEEIKAEGHTDVVDILQALPQVSVDQNGAQNNGVTGAANVDLRGLGSSRTLVLVNGTRLMPGDPQSPVADLNDIPAAMIDHIEVLTGGASAVYGSDALSGVVNFIMRKDFEGIELDGQFGGYEADNTNKRDIAAVDAAHIKRAPQGVLDGGNADVTLVLGANSPDDKGNVTGWIGYHRQSPVFWSARDYGACVIENKGTTGHACIASSNKNRWISIDNSNASPTTGATTPPPPATDSFETGTGAPGSGHFVPFTGSAAQRFNFGALNLVQRGDTRYTGGYFAHYEVSKRLDVYSSLMFADDHTVQVAAPTALFLGAGTVQGTFQATNCTNPLMTAQENAVLCGEITPTALTASDEHGAADLDEAALDAPETMAAEFPPVPIVCPAGGPNCNGFDTFHPAGSNAIAIALGRGYWDGAGNVAKGQSLLEIGRRLVELGNRFTDQRHTAFRIQAGAKGELGDGWTYDIYGQIGISRFTQTLTDASKASIQAALEVDPLTGQCFGAESFPPTAPTGPGGTACVPLDVFNGLGSVTPAAAAYIRTKGILTGYTREHILSAVATGDLGQWGGVSPWAKDPIGASGGVEYRGENLQLTADKEYESNDLAGAGGATLSTPLSGFHVTEFFAEFRVPIIQDAPFAKDLTAELGYRYSIYTPAGDTNTWKADLNWQVTDDIKFRGGFNRAVRAPNVNELFTPDNNVLFSGSDPCATSTAGQCAFVKNAGKKILECPASQCNNLVGGNAALKPEVGFTQTVGVVLTPAFIENFTATIDFYNIKITKAIGKISPQLTLDSCYDPAATAADIAFFCPLVHRNAAGQIIGNGFVTATNQNTGFLETSGIDFGANWAQDLDDWGWTGDGSLSASFLGTYSRTEIVEPVPGHGQYDCQALYGAKCGVPVPDWRHRLRITWQSPWDVDFSVNWRYFGSATVDKNSSQTLLHGAHDAGLDNHIADYNWFDVGFTWRADEHVVLRGGVNNVFGKSPPTLSDLVTPLPFGNANTWPGTYDYLGRQFFIGGTIKY